MELGEVKEIQIEISLLTDSQRDRSRSRRRSRSPRRSRREYDSRSRSRDDYRRSERRSRSPLNGNSGGGGYSNSYSSTRAPPPPRSHEDRSGAKDQMMSAVRENSQQDRRVYVGNLSYDVKWHHLKDFMRQGQDSTYPACRVGCGSDFHTAGEVLFADVLLLPNGMSKVGT
ncbi:hypothetical protein ANO11243_045750 [Dothideomycetidae sp. 11243]|nr:hypothetical protein ANO11243_045750 [fungal sp. No.11243]